METNYSLPVDFGALIRKGPQPKVSLKASIRQYIYLLLLTRRAEWRFDDDFGCLLWEKDFEQTDNLNVWLDEVKVDMRQAIQKHETRLRTNYVDIQREEQQVHNEDGKISRVRNRLTIRVSGTILQNDESFDEEFLMFFGPVTVI